MTTTIIPPKCKHCQTELYAAPTGWVCSGCDARIIPYTSMRLRPAKLDIAHDDEPEPDECDECNGTGDVPCDYCDGTGYTECEHCGSEIDCKHCDGEGTLVCSICKGEGVT